MLNAAAPRSRSVSPTQVKRTMSPTRATGGEMSVADIDPEAVRGALRDFVSQLASSERERVSVKLLTLPVTFLSSLHKKNKKLSYTIY